jgi:hypothetical protein
MNPQLDKQLTQCFPEIFQPRYLKNHREAPLEYWGFECGDGWYGLIYNLCKELMSVPAPAPVAAQVKEKYGTLRFYVDHGTDEHYNIIGHYEGLSRHTCDVCGEPGRLRTGGWMRTLCERLKGRLERDEV